MALGSHNWSQGRLCTHRLQSLSNDPPRTGQTGQIYWWEFGKRIHQTLKITYGIAFFFVSKKDGKLWPCQDYQKLNKGKIKNSYPLLLILTLLDKLKGTKYFTKLDLRSGYNNVQIKDSDQWKAAFKTSRGLFKPTVMFFRLCNSPATFQQMMDVIFWDEIHEAWVIIYMDNIFIFTRELIINIWHRQRILQKLQDNDLFVKPEKCVFWQNKVEYLGMIIEENKIGMDPVKLQGITDWPLTKTVKDIRSFLGSETITGNSLTVMEI